MRMFVAALLLTGCSPSLSLEHVSTLTHATKGVLLHADGQATTGIGGMVCTVQATGSVDEIGVMEDIDFTDADETVHDLYGDTVVASSAEGLHFIDAGAAGDSIALTGVRAARLLDSGVAALRDTDGGCQLAWLGDDAEAGAAVSVDDLFCDNAQMTADPESQAVYIADGSLHRVTPDGQEDLGIDADLADFDPFSRTLFAASGGTVSAVVDGKLAWSRKVDGVVRSVTAYGDTGAALVGYAKDNGRGVLAVFGQDGDDGTPDIEELLPEPGFVVGSDDGTLVAVVLDTETHFFDVCQEDCGPRATFSPRGDDPVRFFD